MNLLQFGILAINDTQLLGGAVAGILLIWLGFRIIKNVAGLFLKIFVILLLLAAAGGIFFLLNRH